MEYILKKMTNKKGVSLMVSYVLLIAIAVGLAIGVYAYLSSFSIEETANCDKGTTIILDSYECFDGSSGTIKMIRLSFRNNGRFNVDGVLVALGNDSEKNPEKYLIPVGSPTTVNPGIYIFSDSLKPGEIKSVEFEARTPEGELDSVDYANIKNIQFQPFIISSEGRVMCEDSVVKQKIESCTLF